MTALHEDAMREAIAADGEAHRALLAGEDATPALRRAADAIEALAAADRDAYTGAVHAIVADFETRESHLTGVPIADTALMFERLAERRGLAAAPESELLPPA